MVEVRVGKDAFGRIVSLNASGHAGWAESGDDIVCAAVSALLQAAWLGLTEVARIDVAVARDTGSLDLRWAQESSADAAVAAIAATAALSLERIAAQYPDHVRVTVERSRGPGGATVEEFPP